MMASLKKILNYNSFTERRVNFVEFSKKYIREIRIPHNKKEFLESTKDFDFFVIGSDQVWNPTNIAKNNLYFSPYVHKAKNISYAPSFGVNQIPEYLVDLYKKHLKNISKISVREIEGQIIIKDLLGIEVPVLVDPTFLLTKNEWFKITKPHEHKPNRNYLLTYYLGEEKKHNMKFIKDYAKRNSLELIHLGDIKDKKRYTADPSEFIDYFNNASMIFTDSFHGSVFSIIFKKPFVVFKRGNMNSRIDTLLSKFNLENRHWDYIKEHNNFNDIDYSHVDEILKEERKKSFDYLRNALGIKKEE